MKPPSNNFSQVKHGPVKTAFSPPLIKQLTEAALEAEIEHYLEQEQPQPNRRNGYSKKTIKATSGSFELVTPRDRNNGFEPQIVKKNQTRLSEQIDDKIISLFALGMS